MSWKHTKTITGSPAEKKVYIRRQYINDEFWRLIENGEHILFTAPRRVGKSSIMIDLEKTCPPEFIAIYHNIESDRTQNEFYERLFRLLIDRLDFLQKHKELVSNWIGSREIGEIRTDGIKIEKKEIQYKDALLKLIALLTEQDIRVVLLLDEFPDVIMSIERNEGKEAAINTLHTLRSIRHEKNFKNFSFVLAGSVGIEHVIASLDRPKLINDLYPINIGELSPNEAALLVQQLIRGATIKIGSTELDHIIKSISYLLPYYVQLMIDKCNSILHKENRPDLTVKDIDAAIEMIISDGRNFDDWEARLRGYLNPADAVYCVEFLSRCAHHEPYPIQKAYDLSKKFVPAAGYKILLDKVLIKDGYVVEETGKYRFLSPFLKQWWKKRHPEFEIED